MKETNMQEVQAYLKEVLELAGYTIKGLTT